MATYMMFGKYSQDSIKLISSKRNEEALALIKEHGGKLISGYALLGDIDLILIADFPDTEQAMNTSVKLSKTLGISFTTAPAVPMETFDRIIESM